ncbi:hypothetical protein GOL81_23130 [Sinorhizobium medicae]|uniref:hypothetical protein n=1 Tax=Sinorhizobium medicae TaxID=110321 RepID=UPI000C7A3D65|nr:hypothetical protein [Sinorhizobium medicae]MDX0568133.1 hypothetical protein [Sinorhizobium medicae]MDX0580759.1 hypothetical protein [Sinorhizobium medicae]MDX0784378.1 hypothetical protein [Sinorhizobium medicae]MDX0893658.1 hypothetical protein [Sinorhizobium medicae]MDX0935346.1 hypothetical protein [Sinorhizobium medicae]
MYEPEIDWSQAPREALWWAIDGDGHAHWFTAPKPFTSFWFTDVAEAPIFGFRGDWKKSLRPRPQEQK